MHLGAARNAGSWAGFVSLALALLLGLPGTAAAAPGDLGAPVKISAGADNGSPGIAYNSTRDEYLAVYEGEADVPASPFNEEVILARRLSSSGAPIGPEVRLSTNTGSLDPIDYDV